MKKSNLYFIVCFIVYISHVYAQISIPYLPLKDDFGGIEVNTPDDFIPNSEDYTLELQGTAGVEIKIAFANLSYTPVFTSKIRFTQKDGKVYVFEDGTFKVILTPVLQYTSSGDNIIQNPSFEEVTETLATGRWKPALWDTWNGGMPTWGGDIGKTNVREDATYRSDGMKSIIMHSETRELLQALPVNTIEANSCYLLTYDYWTSSGNDNGGTTYDIIFREEMYNNPFQTIMGHMTHESGTNMSSFSTIFQMPATVPSDVFFVMKRYEDKVDWLDNFRLYKIIPAAKGFTGATSAVYLSGRAFAPGNLSFENGDYVEMTGRIENPIFDDGTSGWTITASGSKISVTEKAGGLIPGGKNHLQFWTGSNINGKTYQIITDLPNGKYALKAAIVPTAFEGTASLYANTWKTAIISATSKYYEVTGIVFDGSLEIGLEMKLSGSPTIDLDDFTLNYLGIDVEGYKEVLQAKIAEAKADTTAMHDLTLGNPGYNNLSQYCAALNKALNLPDNNVETLLNTIHELDAAINEYACILALYKPLKEAIIDLKTQLASSPYPDKAIFNEAIEFAQAIYDSTDDQRSNIDSVLHQLTEKATILSIYMKLEKAIISATTMLSSTHYPGEADFQEAINAAQAIFTNPDGKDLEAAFLSLRNARNTYYNSQYTEPAVRQTVSFVDTSLSSSEKFVLHVNGKPFYMTNIQVRLDKLYGYNGWNDTELKATIKRAADDGFNTVSIPIHWREIEPDKDYFDWTILDKFMGWCKEYNLKMELLWFSWSSGGRIQYLWDYDGREELRTPDYVCSLDGKSEFNMLRKEWEYSLDWRDTNLLNREKYVVEQMMEHIALWDANNGHPQTIVGIQLGNEATNHGSNSATDAEIIHYYHHVGAAVKESKYVIWTRLNCISWQTTGRINANENKRNSGGTNIDFVGIDIYGTSASSIKGNMNGQLPHIGKNYSMIMEIDAKDSNSPIYQMAAIAGDKAYDYYNMGFVDGNGLYTNNSNVNTGKTLVERDHISEVRQRNKIINLANQDIALKKQGGGLFVYNYAGNSTGTETGIEGISFKPESERNQAIAIRRSDSEIVLLSTTTGTFTIPSSLPVVSVSKGYFDKDNKWVNEGTVSLDGTRIIMPMTSAILLKLKVTGEEVPGTGIDIPTSEKDQKRLMVSGGEGGIIIMYNDNGSSVSSISIYDVTGHIVKTVKLTAGSFFVPLVRGIYIVNNQKVIVS